jgi:hypothetical protein
LKRTKKEKDGSFLPVEITGHFSAVAASDLVYRLPVISPSARGAAEETLQKAHDELERKVEELYELNLRRLMKDLDWKSLRFWRH